MRTLAYSPGCDFRVDIGHCKAESVDLHRAPKALAQSAPPVPFRLHLSAEENQADESICQPEAQSSPGPPPVSPGPAGDKGIFRHLLAPFWSLKD